MLVASTAVDGPAQYVGMLVAVIVGALSGESIGFALGRFFGPKIRDSRLGRRIGIKNWHRAENYVDRRGGIAVFVSRFLPVLHSLVPRHRRDEHDALPQVHRLDGARLRDLGGRPT